MVPAFQSDNGAFRVAMRRMAATVSIISTRLESVPYGMTATAVSPVSMDPPSLLVAVNQSASIHAPIKSLGVFWVNLLGEDHIEQCQAFSGKLSGSNRFHSGTWIEERGMPLLADAQANICCEVELQIPFATHTIFISRVIEVRASGSVRPLVYLDGQPRRVPLHQNMP